MDQIIKLGLIMLLIDSIYIYFISNYFSNQIMQVQSTPMEVKKIGYVLTYMFLIAALYYFIVKENKSELDAFILGICIYGVYEFTNYSLLTNWTMKTSLIDTVWGGILFALTTKIIYSVN